MARPPFSIEKCIADLIVYAKSHLDLDDLDAVYAQNRLLRLFGATEPQAPTGKQRDLQTDLLDPMVRYAVKNKLTDEASALLFETEIMGLVTPAPSYVVSRFDNIAAVESPQKATDYLYDLSVNSNYIRMADIRKNIRWTAPGTMGDITVTINLSKPEKDAKQVALEKAMAATNYPKCALCIENVGFAGNFKRAARQTLRTIPIILGDEEWFFQFSPYVYYDNHCIAFSKEHRPMAVTPKTFTRLLDFCDLFPYYFIGSNADLPIVGGSILSHDHYQGGNKVLPMFRRDARKVFAHPTFPNTQFAILDWYNSVVRLSSFNRAELEKAAAHVLQHWRVYTDQTVGVIARTDEPHNTVTPIATYDKQHGYVIYLILRNNRTDDKHPDGIFHPTADMHNIKKEGIGLIEAMGIFILPGRLAAETEAIVNILTGAAPLDFSALSKEDNPLGKHLGMIAQLTNDCGTSLSPEAAERAVVDYINNTCVKILECTAVFKNTEEGQQAFEKFLKEVGAYKE